MWYFNYLCMKGNESSGIHDCNDLMCCHRKDQVLSCLPRQGTWGAAAAAAAAVAMRVEEWVWWATAAETPAVMMEALLSRCADNSSLTCITWLWVAVMTIHHLCQRRKSMVISLTTQNDDSFVFGNEWVKTLFFIYLYICSFLFIYFCISFLHEKEIGHGQKVRSVKKKTLIPSPLNEGRRVPKGSSLSLRPRSANVRNACG